MPLVMAKCTNCGGVLEIDSSKDAVICTYCGTPFISEKAVNNYTNNIEHLHADTVVLSDGQSVDDQVKAGEALIEAGNFDSAELIFKKLIDNYPEDYRSWYGNCKLNLMKYCCYRLRHMRYIRYSYKVRDETSDILKSSKNALVLAPDNEIIKEIQSTYEALSEAISSCTNDIKAIETKTSEEKRRIHDKYMPTLNDLKKSIAALTEERRQKGYNLFFTGAKSIDRQLSQKRADVNTINEIYDQELKDLETREVKELVQIRELFVSRLKQLDIYVPQLHPFD